MSTNLKLLVTHLTERYEGEYAPNVEAVWDENEVEQNSEGWGEVVKKAQTAVASGSYDNAAVLTVAVDSDLLYGAPTNPTPAEPDQLDWLASKPGQYGLRLVVGLHQDGSETWTQIVDAWDSYMLEENSEGFREKLATETAKVGSDYAWLKIVDLYLPEAVIDRAIAPWKQVHQAELVSNVAPEPEPGAGLGYAMDL